MLEHKLFREGNGKGSKMAQAAQEAVRAKKAAGAVRYLWRNARSNSHEQVVQEMKDLLRQSPQQEHNAAAEEAEEEFEAVVGAEPSSDEDGESGEASQGESNEAAQEGEGAAPHDLVLKSPAEDNECGESSETDSLNAPTLKMGENVDSEEEPFPDSQVKTGCSWLSKFYAKGDPDKKEPDNEECVQNMLASLTQILKFEDGVMEPLGRASAGVGISCAFGRYNCVDGSCMVHNRQGMRLGFQHKDFFLKKKNIRYH